MSQQDSFFAELGRKISGLSGNNREALFCFSVFQFCCIVAILFCFTAVLFQLTARIDGLI